jgi:HrpA-like RNA helicase
MDDSLVLLVRASSSTSVPGIRHVIDSGLTQRHYFDPDTGLDRWIVVETSQAEATQRAGRAGRIQPGKVYRLYTEPRLMQMEASTPPDIVRTNLTSLLLTLKSVGVDNLLSFDLMTVPPVATLAHGLETLFALGAMDDRTNLTSFGRKLSCFPIEPRISALLLKSLELGCSWDALGTASALALTLTAGGGGSSSPMLWLPPRQSTSSSSAGQLAHQRYLDFQGSLAEVVAPSGDHVTYANLLSEFEQRHWGERDCRDRHLNYSALKRCREIRRYLAAVLRGFGTLSPAILDEDVRSERVLKCVCAGFFFNVAKLGPDGRYYTLRKQIAVSPSPSSALSLAAGTSSVSYYIIFGESVDGPRGGMELRSVSSIEAKWLREVAPHYWDS